jgi:4-hydroxyacetophenone monooxygenase
MASHSELLSASDYEIDDAVKYMDPMLTRGLLYQLTGDESLADDAQIERVMFGFLEVQRISDESKIALLQRKAADYLKAYRDSGAGDVSIGPVDRLQRSLSLSAGVDLPDSEIEMWLEILALDPWERGVAFEFDPLSTKLDLFQVVVIGAGLGGLNAAAQLKHTGIPFRVFEKNADVGGTWFENRYPGARVDTPSRTYTHIFAADYQYPNMYCEQSENEKYFNWVADHLELRSSIEFDTEVSSIVWDDAQALWIVTATGPSGTREVKANAVISAVGFLSRPNMPEIKGMDDFGGRQFHSARWPADLDLGGKRVAIVGSGSSGYQMLPEIAKLADHTYFLQRRPNWCFEVTGYTEPLPPQVLWLDRNFPFHSNFMRFRLSWLHGPTVVRPSYLIDPEYTEDPQAPSAFHRMMRNQRETYIKDKMAARPDLVKKMIPVGPPMSARPVVIDASYNVYDALLRDDVTLVSEQIEKVHADGILTVDGGAIPVDVIVYATGFKTRDFLWPMDVRGRDGKTIADVWAKDGARAYLGAMVPGFPNFFMLYGPNTNPAAGGLNLVDFEEMVTRFALECIRGLIEEDKTCVDVTEEAYRRWAHEVDRWEARMIFHGAHNYWGDNGYGRSAGCNSIDSRLHWHFLRSPLKPLNADWPELGWYPPNSDIASIRPFVGEDLIME